VTVTGQFFTWDTHPARPGWNPDPCTRCGHVHLGRCFATSSREHTWTGKPCGCPEMVTDDTGDAA
jgi:hypothetical protein